MPKKKNQESQKEQSERFEKTVADLVAAGELNPTEGESAVDGTCKGMSVKTPRARADR